MRTRFAPFVLVLVLVVATRAFAQEPPATVPPEPGGSQTEKSDGPHAYMGGVVGGLLPVVWNNGGVGAQLAVRGGVLISGFQLQLEVAPATVIGAVARDPIALLDVTGSVGYLIPMNEMVSWIVRFGGGGGAVLGFPSCSFGSPSCSTASVAFGEFRADVAGVAIRTSKHLMVECNAPSFRMMVMDQRFGANVMFMWVTNVGIHYVF